MKIHMIAIGRRMPAWVDAAYETYARRLPSDYRLTLNTLPLRGGFPSTRRNHKDEESKALIAACPAHAYRIVLDRQGQLIDTVQLSQQLLTWHDQAQDIALLIGGPDGVSATALQQAHAIWSLSKLTLAHPLARVLIAEQIYRAWSILTGHPYHRG